MTVVRAAEIVDAPPEEVWRVVEDPRNLPRWNRYVRSVAGVPESGLTEGSRYTTELGALGVTVHVDAEVLELDPPRFSRIRLSGPLDATVRTWVSPVGSRRSRLEQEVDYTLRGGPVGALVAGALRMIGAPSVLRRGVRAQKRQVEEG